MELKDDDEWNGLWDGLEDSEKAEVRDDYLEGKEMDDWVAQHGTNKRPFKQLSRLKNSFEACGPFALEQLDLTARLLNITVSQLDGEPLSVSEAISQQISSAQDACRADWCRTDSTAVEHACLALRDVWMRRNRLPKRGQRPAADDDGKNASTYIRFVGSGLRALDGKQFTSDLSAVTRAYNQTGKHEKLGRKSS